MSWNCKVCVLLSSNTKFCYQINGGDQSTIHQTTKIQNESFWSPYVWWLKKNSVATWLATKCFKLSQDWQWKSFSYHKIGNQKKFVAMQIATEKIQSPQDWQLNFGHCRILWQLKKLYNDQKNLIANSMTINFFWSLALWQLKMANLVTIGIHF
jgi:hypothetical protein